MTPKLITFDCANTLIWTDWSPDRFAVRCAEMAGLPLPGDAGAVYMRLFKPKLASFVGINMKGGLLNWRAFWVQQVEEWLAELGIQGQDALALHMLGEKEIFETPSNTFKLFSDTLPTLARIRELGIPMAVLSNWDLSLDGCLKAHGIDAYFDAIFASLVFGVEKPDPRFFQHALDTFGVEAHECVHVGDLVEDDLAGAQSAGIHGLLIDRSLASADRGSYRISSLLQVEGALSWFD